MRGAVADAVRGGAGVDSRSGHVFCFLCQDYIYDPALEEIRIEQEVSKDGGGASPSPSPPISHLH